MNNAVKRIRVQYVFIDHQRGKNLINFNFTLLNSDCIHILRCAITWPIGRDGLFGLHSVACTLYKDNQVAKIGHCVCEGRHYGGEEDNVFDLS